MNWFDANDHCKTEGGKLVEIDSKEENTALVEEMIRQGYGWKNMHFWMGGYLPNFAILFLFSKSSF